MAEEHKLTKEQLDEIARLKAGTDKEAYQNYSLNALIGLHGTVVSPPPGGEPTLPADGRPQPEKGANKDAKTWKAVAMRDDPTKWKVVDAAGINVADLFISEATAKQYIAYYVWKQGQVTPPPPPPPPGPGPTGDKDQFGITKIFPDKPGGFVSTEAEVEYKTRNYASGAPSEPTVELTLSAPSGHQQDIEATTIVTMKGMTHNDTIDWKIRGPGHSDGSGKSWYCIDQETDGGHGKMFQVESPHPSMHNNSDKVTKYFAPPNISNVKIGWKGIAVNKGPNDAYIACWINLTPDNEAGWKKVWDIHDTGQVSSSELIRNGATGGNIQVRIDGIPKEQTQKPTFEKSSIREISYSEASATRV